LYDGAGRRTADIAYALGTEAWRTTYSYGGNSTTTMPPAGATPTTTLVAARGHTTDLIAYHAGVPADYVNDPAADYTDTTYTYTSAGRPATQKDAAGTTWSWSYDLLGRQTDAYDPDTGHTTFAYDKVGNVTGVTNVDDAGKQTTFVYDAANRKTAAYDTTATSTLSPANQIAGWTYDTVKAG